MMNSADTLSPRPLPDAQLTHVGIYVDDLDRMVDFYRRALGLLLTDRGEINGRQLAFLSRTQDEHHQLVLAHDPNRQPSGESTLNQVSFRVQGLAALSEMYAALLPDGLPGMEGRHHGNSWSFYFFDPEGNKVEIYAVTPWQVRQPWRRPLDLTRPVVEIEQETRALLQEVEHRPIREWQADMRSRLGAPEPAEPTSHFRSLWTAMMRVPFEQAWVQAGPINTRYAHAGQRGRPAVVLLHGTAGSWEGFAANLGALAQHFDCYAIDMVGSGFSDKPDRPYEISEYVSHLRAFMDAMQLEQAALVGCSLGSWVGARFALTHPQRVTRLVLLSAAGLFANASNMSRIRSARTAAVNEPTWKNIKPIFDHLIHEEHNRIPDLIAVRQAVYQQPGMARAMSHILCLQDPGIRDRNLISEDEWRRINAPALVVGSLADKDEYLETAIRISKLIPDARYVEMPGVGHWPHFEDPEAFNPMCIEFLQSGA
jgi:2-hydroxy-6-oxonona-2,4-dienedioate hydrolase